VRSRRTLLRRGLLLAAATLLALGRWRAGISDLSTGRHDIAAALAATRDDGAPIVLLKHSPDARYAAGHVVENGRHLRVATGLGTSILPVRFRVPLAVDVLMLSAD
jgi:predicted MPP superfamily phosphohydrolase